MTLEKQLPLIVPLPFPLLSVSSHSFRCHVLTTFSLLTLIVLQSFIRLLHCASLCLQLSHTHSLCFLLFHSLSVALYLSLLLTCSLLECQHEEMPVFLYPSFRKTPIFPKAPYSTTITNNNSDSQKATLVRPLVFTSSEKTN